MDTMDEELEYAWLEAEGKLYHASASRAETQRAGRSPIITLIEKIYFTESFHSPSQAKRLLRERIHSTYAPSITERETVKIAAKRLAAPVESLPSEMRAQIQECVPNLMKLPPLEPFRDSKLKMGERIDPVEIPRVLERLRLLGQKFDRPVSALLIDSEDRVLGWSWNTNAVIKTRHAEWNLCAGLPGKIPPGARFWVSLKPCRMCAARIWEQCEDPARIEVIYLENDPGPFAQGTLLDAGSPSRLRYFGPRDPRLEFEIQRAHPPQV